MSELFHIASEQAILGGLLLDPKALDRIDWLQESDFYREDHRLIFRHVRNLVERGMVADVVTVAESLDTNGLGESTGGLAYLGDLAVNTPSAANIARYAEVVAEKRQLRDLLEASSRIADIAREESGIPIVERIDEAQSIVYALGDKRTEATAEPVAIGSFLVDVITKIEERYNSGGGITGLSTGLDDLDEKTCGLQPADLIIVAGRPSMGKTTLAINIAEHVSAVSGLPSAVFSMEMSKEQLAERSLASIGGVSMGAMRSGRMTDEMFPRLSAALGKLVDSKLMIDDSPALSVMQIRSRCRRIAKKHGLALVVVDYIQLARGEGQNREQEVSSVSRGLKAIAKEFRCPVIALSQLSRKVEDRPNKRPMMSDLRDSGAIEQDADVILMMYRDEYYNPDTPDKGIAEIIIGKQRMGETGIVPVVFQGEFSRFKSLSAQARQELFESREQARPAPMARRRKGIE